jgi:hypothetical protein
MNAMSRITAPSFPLRGGLKRDSPRAELPSLPGLLPRLGNELRLVLDGISDGLLAVAHHAQHW